MNPTAIDPEAFKVAARDQWNRHAKGWSDHSAQIAAWLRDSTDAMLTMAGVNHGARVLDVAAGAGDQTIDIAKRVGPEGYVLGTDISPTILVFAAENAAKAGCSNIQFETADGEDLDVPAGSFDAAICRLGLMLFPNPGKALQEMWRALKPGGRCCTMVFSSPEKNPCVSALMGIALKHAGRPLRDPYTPGGLLSLGKPGLIDDLFRQAGFTGVATTRVLAPFRLPTVKDYVEFVRSSASPVVQVLDSIDEASRVAAWAEIEITLSAFNGSGGWEGPNELLLTVGSRG